MVRHGQLIAVSLPVPDSLFKQPSHKRSHSAGRLQVWCSAFFIERHHTAIGCQPAPFCVPPSFGLDH